MLSRNSVEASAEKKKTFDVNKAIVMRNDGLSLEVIAKEFGCCPQTVANQLNKAGYTKQEGGTS